MQTAFLVPFDGELKRFSFGDVLFIHASDKYCEIFTVDKKQWLVRVPLNYMQKMLPENCFVRVHRSLIISLNKIDAVGNNTVTIAGYKLSISKEGYRCITARMLVICPEFEKGVQKEIEGLNPKQYVERSRNEKQESPVIQFD